MQAVITTGMEDHTENSDYILWDTGEHCGCSVDVKVQVSCCLLELRLQSGQDEEQTYRMSIRSVTIIQQRDNQGPL